MTRGVDWIVHPTPSHRSARRYAPRLLNENPTEVQAEDDEHDTPHRDANPTPGGLGLVWRLHAAPSHRSTRVCTVPAALCVSPVAVQAEGEMQDTPLRKLCTAPAGLGVGWMVHAVPSHRSISGVLFEPPTATQFEPDRHATPASWPDAAPVGSAVCWMVHAVPSHPSPRVTALPALSPFVPTAMQEEAVGQARPNSQL